MKKFAMALLMVLGVCSVAWAYSATINSYDYDISYYMGNYVLAPPSGTHDVPNWTTGLTYEVEIKCDQNGSNWVVVASGSGPANDGVWGTNLGQLAYYPGALNEYPPQPDCPTTYDGRVHVKIYKEAWHTCPWQPGNCDRTLMYEQTWSVTVNTVQ